MSSDELLPLRHVGLSGKVSTVHTKQLDTFRAWVKEIGGVTKVAKLLGHSVPYLSRIHNGSRTPGLQLATRIERAAGVSYANGTEREERLQPMRLPASGWVE